ncbi:MAG: LysM peptidoglycan-binding domain-containing protein [Bacteroidales bacterium]
MNRSLAILVFICFLSCFHAQAQEDNSRINNTEKTIVENGKAFYLLSVKPKQTLYAISKKYNVPIDEIKFYNPEIESGIKIGQELKIPAVNRETQIVREMKSSDFEFIYHIVNKGDNIQKIADLYDLKVFDIKLANPRIKDPLKEGEYIKIPVITEEETVPPVDDNRGVVQGVNKQRLEQLNNNVEKDIPVAYKEDKYSKGVDEDQYGRKIHTIQPKETLFGICRKFQITRTELENVNPGLDPNLKIGQVIYLPENSLTNKLTSVKNKSKNTTSVNNSNGQLPLIQKQNKEKPKGLKEHKVRRKETLYRIARKYGVTIDEIKTFNPGVSENIREGEIIKIPASKITEPFIEHKVERKTKLNRIAKKYGLSYYQIERVNPDLGKRVYSGTIVKIPVNRNLVNKVEVSKEIKEVQENQEEKINALKELYRGFTNSNPDKVFSIALMVPLRHELTDSLYRIQDLYPQKVFNSSAFEFIQFAEGFQLAADSLSKLGMNIELYVYDVEKASSAIKLYQNNELKRMDLIVGPFYSKAFNQVANFAKVNHIPIVNPLTTREEVLVNNNVFKVKPGFAYKNESVSRVISQLRPYDKIIIVNDPKEGKDSRFKVLKNEIKSLVPQTVRVNASIVLQTLKANDLYRNAFVDSEGYHIDINQLKQSKASLNIENTVSELEYGSNFKTDIAKLVSRIRPTMVIVSTKSKGVTLEILDKLNQVSYKHPLSVLGLLDWGIYENDYLDYLINLNATYISDGYVDYSKDYVRNFVYQFRNRFDTEPNKYAFDGFDIGFYFMGILGTCGNNFIPCLETYQPHLLKRKMNFKKSKFGGFENSYWIPLHFNGAKIEKVE